MQGKNSDPLIDGRHGDIENGIVKALAEKAALLFDPFDILSKLVHNHATIDGYVVEAMASEELCPLNSPLLPSELDSCLHGFS